MGKMTIWKVKCLARVVDTFVIETVVRPVQNSIQQRKMFSDEIFIILDSIREALKKKTIFFVTNVTLWGGGV